MSEEEKETNQQPLEDDFADDFDFVEHYSESAEVKHEEQLPENTAASSLNCAFVGVGGGGGKMAKAFLDLGYNKTILVNTTEKDQPAGVDSKHLVLIPNADGVAKDVSYGKTVFENNGAVVEDALRTKLGKVDWLFVLAGGGGGTGSACASLHKIFERYLASVQAGGKVVYIVSWPSSQELLNPTIAKNALSLINDVGSYPHIVVDNERQIELLRGKVGMLNMFPVANKTFSKLFNQILKLSSENSPIQTFDSKDLERTLKQDGRIFLGSTIIRDPKDPNLGAQIFQNCLQRSPCAPPKGKPKTGTMLLVLTEELASDPEISKHLDAAMSYVGGRTDTLFTGVYVKKNVPGLVTILTMTGIQQDEGH